MKKPEDTEAPRDEAAPDQSTRVVSAHWSGPLPPPAQLEDFERIVPGGAQRIFAQFETEASHRRAMEKQAANFVIRDTHIGQALASLYALAAFTLTAFAIMKGSNWVAAILGGGTIVSGVIAFLRGSPSRTKEETNSRPH